MPRKSVPLNKKLIVKCDLLLKQHQKELWKSVSGRGQILLEDFLVKQNETKLLDTECASIKNEMHTLT